MSYRATVLHNVDRMALVHGVRAGDTFDQVFETEVHAGALQDAA